MSEITNPYRPGEPVVYPDMLFGRQDAVDWLELQVTNNARTLIFSGQPFIGKTSLIQHMGSLQNSSAVNLLAFLPEPIASDQPASAKKRSPQRQNVQAIADAVLQQVIEQLIPQLSDHHLIGPEPVDASISASSVLYDLFAQAGQQLNNTTLILYLDDLHHLVTDDLALSATFLSAFIPVLDTCPQLHLVFTINQDKLQSLRHPLLDGAPTFSLTPLTADASVNMITRPVRNMLRFDYGIPRRIAEVNSHHPYYLCLFCHTLLNRQVHDGWVNQRDFDSALGEVLDSPIDPFTNIWEESGWAERAVLAGMAAMQGKHGPMTQQEVVRFLQKENQAVVPEVIIEALQTLAERGILVPMGAVSYRFYVELFRFWLRQYIQPAEILKKIDWNRLAGKIKLQMPKHQVPSTSYPGHASQQKRPKRRFIWPLLLTLLVIVCLLTTGGIFAWQFLGLSPLAFLTTPTPTPTATPKNQAATGSATDPTATPATEPTPTITPTPAMVVKRSLPSITYMGRDIDQSWKVYVMDNDGTNVTALSPEGVDDTAPTWSSDGQKIAFVSQRDGNREIYVMDADGQNVVNVTRHPADDWTPAWSPDGTQLAFSSLRDGSWEIYVINTACLVLPESCIDSLSQITSDGNLNISPVWSPDGSRFAFNSKVSGNWDIYLMNTDGSSVRQVTVAPENDLSPAWSPDGTQIAFESNRDGNVEIYITDINRAAPPVNISNYSTANDHGPTWSPDGQMIVFYSNREGDWDIFSTTIDGNNVFNLTQTPNRDEQTPAWRP